MRRAWLLVLTGLWAAAAALPGRAYEVNAWPFFVLEKDPGGRTVSWTGLGPLLFSQPSRDPGGGLQTGLRPLHVRAEQDGAVRTDMLYPLFYYRQYDQGYAWSVLQLIDGRGTNAGVYGPGTAADTHFDVWPFYFAHDTPDAGQSYHSLFPVLGDVKHRLGYQELTWTLFPLYVTSEKARTRTTYTPWPFVRTLTGDQTGFAVWPLLGASKGPGVGRRTYALWPFFWDNTVAPGPDAPEGTAPGHQVGLIPLFTYDRTAGSVDVNYLWPFFGFTQGKGPTAYSETRYLWPFLVKGRGDGKSLDRVAPLYAHSEALGASSTWLLWPLWHKTEWTDGDIHQQKTQLLYFVFWSLDQSSVSRPGLAHAYKGHIWPLFSVWDNGAGSRQVQAPNPLEVFFPDNPDMRQTWTPFFALYRYERRPGGESRHSVLWNAVTWRRDGQGNLRELHVGPLLSVRREGPRPGWGLLGLDFPMKGAVDSASRR